MNERVAEVFGVLGEKPKFDAARIGEVKAGAKKRPIKVKFRSSTVSRQVLSKAPKLRDSETFYSVCISPDRTPEQRVIHRDLVSELKRRRAEEKDKTHFIRNGRVETK